MYFPNVNKNEQQLQGPVYSTAFHCLQWGFFCVRKHASTTLVVFSQISIRSRTQPCYAIINTVKPRTNSS